MKLKKKISRLGASLGLKFIGYIAMTIICAAIFALTVPGAAAWLSFTLVIIIISMANRDIAEHGNTILQGKLLERMLRSDIRDLRRKRDKLEANIDGYSDRQAAITANIMSLIEGRDIIGRDHVRRAVSFGALIIEGCMEDGIYADTINKDFLDLFKRAAPTHDLGKLLMPENILKAPRRLSDVELEIARRHAEDGAKLIPDIYDNLEPPALIAMAANIARHHHERFDGTGYPYALSGQGIPLEARVMAIADVFDALVSDRIYKKAFDLDTAFGEIERCSGSFFDPRLVSVFLDRRERVEGILGDIA